LASDNLSKYYNVLIALAATLLFVFALTAYSKNLPQLGFFGLIFCGMTVFGWVTWLFNVHVFNDDEEPYFSQFILVGVALTICLFVASSLVGIFTRQYSFLATLQLGQGVLAPLSGIALDPSATTLTFIMNVPGPIAEEAFFRVFLCTAFTMGFGKGNVKGSDINIFHKALIVAISSVSFGFFHWYAYAANTGQILAAIIAGVILSFYYVFIQRSALIVTCGHFIYNFAVLILSLVGTLGLTTTATASYLLALVPLVGALYMCNLHYFSKPKLFLKHLHWWS